LIVELLKKGRKIRKGERKESVANSETRVRLRLSLLAPSSILSPILLNPATLSHDCELLL